MRLALSFLSRSVFAVCFLLILLQSLLLLYVFFHFRVRHLTYLPLISAIAGHVSGALTVIAFDRGSLSPVGPIDVHCVGILLSRRIPLLISSALWGQLERPWLPGFRVLAIVLSRLVGPGLLRFVGLFFCRRAVRSVIESLFGFRYVPLTINGNRFLVPLTDRDRLRP